MATSKNERLLNLVICLMSAKTFVTAEYLRTNIVGYKDTEQSPESFKRMLERDKNELRALGIPVETGYPPMGGDEGYRILPEHYALRDISLTEDEAAVIAAAAALWHDPDVAVESQTAVLKLKAAGIDVTPPEELGFGQTGGGRSMGDERAVRALLAAVGDGRAVTFTHRSGPTASERTLEPWGVVTNSGRWYVVGYDRDRDATRTFRVSRISDVRAIGGAGEVTAPEGTDLSALVAAAVDRASAGEPSTARVWLAEGRAWDLRRDATDVVDREWGGEPGQEATVAIRSRSWLIRTVLAAGRDVVVLDPPDLRAAVVAELDALTAAFAPAHEGDPR
ncbi:MULTISPECIES: helix-turn-helix transcriptional regulator [unclassified Gordonia (in: high G+C Gram-positive bacteria)]|uniref:helix-turn-helix transcriptional regulator n=1 Tax=unclassified Gordonia (in: high G+C Gram-positive bacteria) TaxID=2657482 RepID=UPI001FFFA253|nr:MULTISPECIES: YafY family protein [unclassified Gordonia (in: high G+C Gram-positive bacteria)]UQE76754.1 YafY family transcriptional regulator [Gordonia sp. PP30]